MAFAEAMSALQAYVRSAEALAALGAKIGAASGNIAPSKKLLAKLDAVQGHHEPGLLDGLNEAELDALYGFVRASLRQMLHLVELPADGEGGWSHTDPGVLQAQGRSSRLVTRLLTDFAGVEPDFSRILSEDASFLDVGSGVGWISLSMAQQWPRLRATGIDILDPALELAQQNLNETGLSDRVSFRNQDVVELDDRQVFDVAFIPVIFIPEAILAAALAAVRRALKPGGWLFAAAYRIPEIPRQAALNDLKTTLSGGRTWEVAELADILTRAGFAGVKDIGSGSPLHLLSARRVA